MAWAVLAVIAAAFQTLREIVFIALVTSSVLALVLST